MTSTSRFGSDRQRLMGAISAISSLLATAQVGAQTATSPGNQPTASTSASPSNLEEVVVTAQKREERLIDVPESVTVLSGSNLAQTGAIQLSDFVSDLPGVSFQTLGSGNTNTIVVRGVTNGSDITPSTAVYLDDVPLSATAHVDVGVFDLDRVELLRGPQGTLYGTTAMGGLLKYVSRMPDTQNFSGSVQTGVSDVEHGGVDFNVSASLNLPLISDKVAARVTGFESHSGGYIDNVALNDPNADRHDVDGGRLDLLITPTDALAIRIDAFAQNISSNGESTVDYTANGGAPLYGELEQYRKFGEPFNDQFRLVSGTATYDFGWSKLTSVSAYQSDRNTSTIDISASYVPIVNGALGTAYTGMRFPIADGLDKVTQEIRFEDDNSRPIQWAVGAFYTHEAQTTFQGIDPYNADGTPGPLNVFNVNVLGTYTEYAVFGNLTWHITDKFDITGGARESRNNTANIQYGGGAFIGNGPFLSATENVATYLANARYHFNDYSTAYLRFATGYRPGGPNAQGQDPTTHKPLGLPEYKSDTLKSYEGGYKAETVDHRFGIDMAIYDIDWTGMQLTAFDHGFGYSANVAGGATIQGAELTLTARPIEALTASGAFAYQHAYLQTDQPVLGGFEGERLPSVPRATGSLKADYAIQPNVWKPTVGAAVRFISDRFTTFVDSTRPDIRLPGYTTLEVHGGLDIASFKLQLYVHNVFDTRGELSQTYPQFGTRIAIIEPRTIGMVISQSF